MLTLTPAAGDYLCSMLERARAPSISAVRIVIKPEGLRTAIDQEKAGDVSLDHDGRTVLLLAPEVADVLSERTLDVESDGSHLICLA